ncbi:MAG: hypothetical protein BWK77_01875 [Verrucomicrobia bacterium A1]|nr:MAG: hypothetical protein BWK77_01875 [Verrucomicrobia bacterium A1]
MREILARFAVVASAGLAACTPLAPDSPSPAAPAAPAGPAIPQTHGYNIHFTDPKPGEMEMIAASGAKWVRMDFTWGATERQPGVYDFTAYERLMAALDRQGIRALFILDYANRLYDEGLAPSSDAGRAAFAKWAVAAATHFKDRGILWEMWNEPNIDPFWKPKANVADYVALARTVGRALREATPGEAFVGPGVSRIDLPFLEACLQGGLLEDWSAVTVHPYRHLSGPETVVAEYGQLRDLIAKHAPNGKVIPILSGEWGFSSAWRGFDAASQGAMLARQWLVNAACDIPLSIWYDWHDDGKDPKEAEHNFGTVSNAYHEGRSPVYDPKPAYLAASSLNRTLDGFRFVRRISPPRAGAAVAMSSPEDWVLLFRRGPDIRLAAWTTGTATPDIRLPGLKAPVRGVAHTGGALPDLAPDGDGLTVRLSHNPVYLLPPPGAAASLVSAVFRHDWADGRIATVAHVPGADGGQHITVNKAFGASFRGRIALAANGADIATARLVLPAGAAQTTLVLRAAAPVGAALALRVERDDHAIVHQTRPRRPRRLGAFAGRSGFRFVPASGCVGRGLSARPRPTDRRMAVRGTSFRRRRRRALGRKQRRRHRLARAMAGAVPDRPRTQAPLPGRSPHRQARPDPRALTGPAQGYGATGVSPSVFAMNGSIAAAQIP